ncbi:MAG: class I SAM-dependent methyltransferase, partial [Bdellovibrionales bacterium]|nr:class I SAM-dependent methyltransferase [Bdellovibrionales bacterium]NQZ20381.1 class I SAM-dependent methyltransferase [Bdellovibrionales bacterium]
KVVKEKGHNVYNQPIEELSFDQKFDAITLWDVFEHLKSGTHFLDIYRNMLTDEGVLFLQVPNSGSLAAIVMQGQCNMFDGLEHVNLYSPKAMRTLAENANYEILHMETVIPEINVMNNYLNYEHPYTGEQPATNSLMGFITPEVLEEHLLGYKLQVVLKPKK